jgi:hypothetical protein
MRGALALALLLSAGAAAVESWQPVQPAAGSHSHRLGWSFEVPAGWRVRDVSRASALAPPGTKYDLTRGDLGQVFAVTAFDDVGDPKDPEIASRLLRTLAHNGWEPLGEPQSETVSRNDRSIIMYTWSFRPARRAAPMETRVYLVPERGSGATMLLLAASERDLLTPLDADLLRVASSLRFPTRNRLGPAQWTDWGFQRETPPGPGMPDPGDVLADESVPSQQWFFYLRGKRITPMPGSTGTRQSLDLRDDGTFQATRSGTASAASPAIRGRWRIVTRARITALVLYWERSEPTFHRLERRGDVILVGEIPTTVVRPE